MRKTSVILKTLTFGGTVSCAVLDTTAVVGEAIARHRLSPVAAAALGRTLTATAYLCSWLKDGRSSLSVALDGGGPGGKVCAAGDGALRVRGFVGEPSLELPPRADGKLDVGGFVGRDGTISVIRDDGSGVPFSGACPLVSGEIAEDFSAYFLVSEQRPTAVALGVRIGADGQCLGAGGVFLQPLPGAGEEAVSRCEREIANFKEISALVARMGARGVLRTIADGEPSVRTVRFACRCSRKKAERAVLAMGEREAEALLSERGAVEVTCEYCGEKYAFDRASVGALFARGGRG